MSKAVAWGEPAGPRPYGTLAEAITGEVARLAGGQFIHAKRDGALVTNSYADILAHAQQLAAAMRAAGLASGDRLIINLEDSEAFVPAMWGAILAGLVVLPFVQGAARHLGAEKRRGALEFASEALGVATVLTDDPAVRALVPGTRVLLFSEIDGEGGILTADGPPPDSETLRVAIMTSGSTGRPKLVGLPERAVMARWWPKVPAQRDSAAFLQWSPFDHVMGLGLAAPNLARKVHLDAVRFAANPLSWLEVIEQAGVTHATMTNFGMSLVVYALKADPQRSFRLESVRKIGVGAEQISPALCTQFYDRLTPFGLPSDAIILGYGLTECGPVVGGTIPFSREVAVKSDGPIALDQPTADHAVRIAGEDGAVLDAGETGNIEVRGPTLTTGYLGGTEQPVFTADGWLRTGDLGFIRDGMLTVIGRAKEVIIFNGKKIACLEIEAAIAARSRFKHVYVAPLPDDMGTDTRGKPVAIFVEVEDGARLADVAPEVRSIVGAAFRFAPAVVGLIKARDVPRTLVGKVQRHALAALARDPSRQGELDVFGTKPVGIGRKSGTGDVEAAISEIWERLLKLEGPIARDAEFYVLGGDSVLALQMGFELEDRFGIRVPLEQFAARSTLGDFVSFIESQGGAAEPEPVQAGGVPLLPPWVDERMGEFLAEWPGKALAPGGYLRRVGTATAGLPVFWCTQTAEEAQQLGAHLGKVRPVFAMRSGNLFLDYESEAGAAFAARYADEIVAAFPSGPYVLAGNCQGTIVAVAVGRLLKARGHAVRLVALADTNFPKLFDGHRFDLPAALIVASRSKFNPYRSFRHPEAGLAKLFSAGHRMWTVAASYPSVIREGGRDLVRVVEEAIEWSATANGTRSERAWYPGSITSGTIRGERRLALRAGQRARITVELHNKSPLSWPPYGESGIALANHWLSPEGAPLTWMDGHAPLLATIAPGEQSEMTIEVTAPERTGDYVLELDLVEEGVRWFSDTNLIPLNIEVGVDGGVRHAPRRLRSLLRRGKRALLNRSK